MLFDEVKRRKLIKEYDSLPSFEREACRVLSALYAPVTATDLARLLNNIRKGAASTKFALKHVWDVKKNLTPTLKRLRLAQLVHELTFSSQQKYWVCNRLITEPLTRESAELGEYNRVSDAIKDDNAFAANSRIWGSENSYDSQSLFMRDLRKAMYLEDEALFFKLISNCAFVDVKVDDLLFKEINKESGTHSLGFMFLATLFNPLDEKIMLNLPEPIASVVFYYAWNECERSPEDFLAARGLLAKFAEKYPDNAAIIQRMAGDLIEIGCPDEAREVLTSSESEDPQKWALLAMTELIKGHHEEALSIYEDGLKFLRKAQSKRKVSYDLWFGFFYPILMIRAGEPNKKILDYISACKMSCDMRMTHLIIRYLVPDGTDQAALFSPDFINYLRGNDVELRDVFFFMLLAYWINAGQSTDYIGEALLACRNMKELGLSFLARELASIIRAIEPDDKHIKNLLKDLPEPEHPLKDLIRREEEWERHLNILANIAAEDANQAAEKRLIWRIDWKRRDKEHIASISIVPVEQTSKQRGWSTGKEIAISTLYKNPDSVKCMTHQDISALRGIRASRDYYSRGGIRLDIDEYEMLRLLAGHPMLFRGKTGESVEIISDVPRISAITTKDSYTLSIEPYPEDINSDDDSPFLAREEVRNCLRIFRFNKKQLKIAALIGEKGLSVPLDAKDKLLKALGSLTSTVTVHSDVAGVESGADEVEPDGKLYLQLQPNGDGLDLEALIRPLGVGSASCVPGVGGRNIFGLLDGRRVRTKRDIKNEDAVFSDFIGKCRALASAEQLSENRWTATGAQTSLELLLQLQELGDGIAVEWPRGGEKRVSSIPASAASFSVRSSRDWFAVSGEIKVDEELVLGMKDIVKLLGESAGRFIPIGNDRFLALTEEFRRRIEELAALGDLKGDELRISPLSAAVLSPLSEEAGGFDDSEGKWGACVAKIDEASAMIPDLPRTFKGELRPYQLEGYRWMTRLAHWGAGACLADDMGLGKTAQSLALLLSRGKDGPALVIAPTSVCPNWFDEASRFTPALALREFRGGGENKDRESLVKSLGAMDVLVSTYGLLQSEQELLCGTDWHTIILDEAQAIKNMGAKRSAAAMKLNSDMRVITTGTPIENNLGELWNLFRFINPGYLGSLEKFNEKFAVPIERDNDKAARKRLKRIISPFVLRRGKDQVLTELPPKTEITIRIDMRDDERAVYEAIRRNAVDAIEATDAQDRRMLIFAQLVKMRRACCNSSLVLKEPTARPSAKLDAFSELIEDIRTGGHKALVFSQFVDHLSILRKRLDDMGVTYQYLDGSTPPAERMKSVKAFQAGEGDCFLISLRAGGTGLNLTAADYVIHMDPWWNPAVEEQASDRTHRIGQSRPVTVYRIVTKGTIEEKIVDLHGWKRDLAESLLDESEAPVKLSSDEMLKLIRGDA
ncbi:SWF/SNF family helicase [Synergistales bacterium]|nr:SWF/SNF family helicase [Synergistales bacterium]